MTTQPSPPRSITPMLMVFRRQLLGAAMLLILLLGLGSHVALTKLGGHDQSIIVRSILPPLMFLRAGTGILSIGWATWVLLYLGSTLWLRRTIHEDLNGASLYLIRLPRPMISPTVISKGGNIRMGMNEATLAQSFLDDVAKKLKDMPALARISLEMWGSDDGKIRWGVWIPSATLYEIVRRSILAIAPDAELIKLTEGKDPVHTAGVRLIREWSIKEDAMYPCVFFDDQSNDTMTVMTSALLPASGIRVVGWHYVISGTESTIWKRSTRWMIRWFSQSGDTQEKAAALAMQTKLDQTGIRVTLRGFVVAKSHVAGQQALDLLDITLKKYQRQINTLITQQWQQVAPHGSAIRGLAHRHIRRHALVTAPPLIPNTKATTLTPIELSAMWHLPGERYLETAIWRPNRYLRPDAAYFVGKLGERRQYPISTPLAQRHLRVGIGRTPTDERQYVGFPLLDATMHGHVIGGTGTGKTRFIMNLFAQTQELGGGTAIIDHKGEIDETFLPCILPEYEHKTVVIDPLDKEWVVGLNLFDRHVLSEAKGLTTDRLTSLLNDCLAQIDPMWASGAGMQQFSGWGAKAILSGEPNATINHLSMFLGSEAYRTQVLPHVRHPQTRAWWTHNFPVMSAEKRASSDALQRRLEGFLRNDLIRQMCNQPRTSIRFRDLIDQRGILIASLPLEKIGLQPGTFIAMLLVTMLTIAGIDRQNLPESERDPFPIHFDEFQESARNLGIRAFEMMIERFRSCGIPVFFSHQHIGQLEPKLFEALLNGAQFRYILAALGDDADKWVKQYGHYGLSKADFQNIPKYEEAYMTAARLPLTSVELLPMWTQPRIHIAPIDADWRVFAPAHNQSDQAIDDRIRQLMTMPTEHAINLLVQAPPVLWDAVNDRLRVHFADQRRRIATERGYIPDTAQRVRVLSNLGFARPTWLVEAEQTRFALRFPRDKAPVAKAPRQSVRSLSAEAPTGVQTGIVPLPPTTSPVLSVNPQKAGTSLTHQTIAMVDQNDADEAFSPDEDMHSLLAGWTNEDND